MSRIALFIRHQAQPGRREDVQRIWEKHVKPRVISNPAQEEYYFCHDAGDPDVVRVFQLYSSEEASREFLRGPWYLAYLAEILEVVVAPPEISIASLIWEKPAS